MSAMIGMTLIAAVPRSVTIRTGAGPCRPTLNGRHVTLLRLAMAARHWRYDQPEIHFQPSERTRYGCVDAVIRILKRQGVTKMGIIGAPVPGDRLR